MRMLETLKFSEEFGSELQQSGQVTPAEDSIPKERKDRLIRWVREGRVKWRRASDVQHLNLACYFLSAGYSADEGRDRREET